MWRTGLRVSRGLRYAQLRFDSWVVEGFKNLRVMPHLFGTLVWLLFLQPASVGCHSALSKTALGCKVPDAGVT